MNEKTEKQAVLSLGCKMDHYCPFEWNVVLEFCIVLSHKMIHLIS